MKREYYHNPGNPDVERALMRSNSVDISEAWRQPSHDHHRLTPRGEARSLMRELAGIGSEFWVAKPCEYVSGGCAVTEYVIRVAVRRGPG